ncbi:hypothetical protein E4T49_04929 [Aureobasidium sp. EXF-10728]|nr:hypothetical protein E4T49_04929 [Aureobasidium sp. EXF-10728]
MSTILWPPLSDASPSLLARRADETRRRELSWLLDALQETLSSLKSGLEDCSALLAPQEQGSTLVVSSHRSEAIKGFITRNGSNITKGDVQLRLASLPPPRGHTSYKLSISTSPSAPALRLNQIAEVRTLINSSLDVVDATTWTGDKRDANFISGQLTLLHDNIRDAKAALKGPPAADEADKLWASDPLDDKIFDPPPPPNLSFHLSIADAALLLHVRTLEPVSNTGSSTPLGGAPSFTGFGLRDRLAHALGAGPRPPAHDEAEDVFTYRGTHVRVKEKVRVESQDPSLISAMAKLAALEHTVELGTKALDVVMAKDDDDDHRQSEMFNMGNLYAEYLPNIKTLAVTTVLETPRNDSTALSLSSDRTKLVIEHDQHTTSIMLPARISSDGTQHLQLPNTGELQCVNRISAEPIFGEHEPLILWSAAHLDPQMRVQCKHCDALVSSDKIQIWKNLPSEAWAEMMDLWHCHKPDEPDHAHDEAPTKKGYAAGNKLTAQVGIGLVDVMSFLLSEDDCTVECRSSENGDNIHQAHCKSCDAILGYRDPQTEGLRLQKPYLALSSKRDSSPQSYDATHWFSCYLNQAIESQGVRKFVFPTLPYEIWVFSTNLAYSSSACPEPTQAMKVLFRAREGDQDVETLRAANLLIETLTLSPILEKLLHEVLQRKNSELPESLKVFMGWKVAVLPVLYSD